ncbi:hypothetical protein HOD19_04520 [bacterium]|jgi:hypothetical protein|nr:hypothetical protein [bacterium]MBT4649008.1 hypothetical protein [bacterium]
MKKKVVDDNELEYRSNENYPWEYEQANEIWVANFDILKKKSQPVEAEENDIIEEKLTDNEVDIDLGEDSVEALDGEIDIDENEIDLDDEAEEDKVELIDEENETETEDNLDDGILVGSGEAASDFDISTTESSLPLARKFSWILASTLLFFIIIAGEVLLTNLSIKFYWPNNLVLPITWLWRIGLLVAWVVLGFKKLDLDKEQIFATSVTAFVPGVVVVAIWKIVIIESVWTWINLLIEPIWMLLVIALFGSLLIKILFRQKH